MKILIFSIAMLLTGIGIVVYATVIRPTTAEQQRADTATSTTDHSGVQPGMQLYAPPSGHTTQDLSGVKDIQP